MRWAELESAGERDEEAGVVTQDGLGITEEILILTAQLTNFSGADLNNTGLMMRETLNANAPPSPCLWATWAGATRR